MDKIITPNQIKQNNRNLIYHYIYQNRNVSQQDISFHLHLSRPTVTANLTAMEADGLIQKSGLIDSEFVGRKAAAYCIIPDYRVSIGVEILKHEINIIAVNLYGEKIRRLTHEITYVYKDDYFKTVCDRILELKDSLNIADEQILGIGFAMQGLISPDRQTVLYGKTMSYTGLSIHAFSRYLPYPCSFMHDADSAATAELWGTPELSDAFYLSIGKHLGAAIISKGQILTGKHGHNSTIEHIQMEPDGRPCYCGKRGCMETLCSLYALLGENDDPKDFFEKMRQGDPVRKKRWEAYLTELAKAVNMLHLVFDTDFILGGHLSAYLREEDLYFIHDRIRRLTPFSEEPDFLLISRMQEHNTMIGSALLYIQNFLDTLSE